MNFSAELSEGLRIGWAAIGAHKLRSTLTTLGVVIGVVTVTLMGAALEGMKRSFYSSISALSADLLIVERFPWFTTEDWWTMRNRRDVSMAQAEFVAEHADFALAVATSAQRRRTVSHRSRSASRVLVVGNSSEAAFVRGLTVQEGRFLSEAEVSGGRPVCVIGAELAEQLFVAESPLGRRIKIEQTTYEVVGVLEKMGEFLFGFDMDNQVIIPITRFITDLAHDPDIAILVKVRDLAAIDAAEEELRGMMRTVRHVPPGEPDDFAINRQEAFVKTFNRMGGVIAGAGLFITGLSLFVGGIGIMNIMFVSVTERTREIGIRKALGAKRRTILIQFLIEAVSICALGGVLALAIAFPACFWMKRLLPAAMSPTVVGVSLAVSVLTGVMAGFFPAYRAARMKPVEALRQE